MEPGLYVLERNGQLDITHTLSQKVHAQRRLEPESQTYVRMRTLSALRGL